jgi:hypothetical protein
VERRGVGVNAPRFETRTTDIQALAHGLIIKRLPCDDGRIPFSSIDGQISLSTGFPIAAIPGTSPFLLRSVQTSIHTTTQYELDAQ